MLLAVTPQGAITGFGLGPASTNDRTLAETFFACRVAPDARLLSVGQPVSDCSVADMGFAGVQCEERWATQYGATVICPAQTGSTRAQRWSKPWRTWLAGIRQVIETVNDRLLTAFGLAHERPHAWDGLQARLAARVGLHNTCLWLNQQHGRPLHTIADLIAW